MGLPHRRFILVLFAACCGLGLWALGRKPAETAEARTDRSGQETAAFAAAIPEVSQMVPPLAEEPPREALPQSSLGRGHGDRGAMWTSARAGERATLKVRLPMGPDPLRLLVLSFPDGSATPGARVTAVTASAMTVPLNGKSATTDERGLVQLPAPRPGPEDRAPTWG